jgi:hypothetical protein
MPNGSGLELPALPPTGGALGEESSELVKPLPQGVRIATAEVLGAAGLPRDAQWTSGEACGWE